MWRDLKKDDVRCRYPEKKLREMAEEMSRSLVVRDWVDGCSRDICRLANKSEREFLRDIMYEALQRLNSNDRVLSNRSQEQAILDNAEMKFISKRLIPSANSYYTVYIPLKVALSEWKLESCI